MRKIIFILLFSFTKIYCQELTISETLKYINEKLGSERKLELEKGGKLIYISRNRSQSISLHEMMIINKDYIKSDPYFGYYAYEADLAYGDFLVQLRCLDNKRGCCEKYGIGGYKVTDGIEILNRNREINEKMFNAIKYLISLAKENIDYQNIDDDPFASQNFSRSFEVISKNSSETIKLINDNGVYKINVKFGLISKQFVLDSGASEISISTNLEKELIHNGLLKKEDYIEPGLYKIADGSIVSCRRIRIRQLKVGNIAVKNITASIGSSSTPLLLGKSFLDKFNQWSINNDSQTLSLSK